MQVMFHLHESASLRIPSSTISVESGCFSYFFIKSLINFSATRIVLSKEIRISRITLCLLVQLPHPNQAY
jgi:hypothetical protein